MVENRQVDESDPYLYDNDNDRIDLFYSAGMRPSALRNLSCIHSSVRVIIVQCSFSFSLLVNDMVHQQPTLITAVCEDVLKFDLSSALWCGWSSSVWTCINPSGLWWVTIQCLCF